MGISAPAAKAEDSIFNGIPSSDRGEPLPRPESGTEACAPAPYAVLPPLPMWASGANHGPRRRLRLEREASDAYIKSQAHEGWRLVRERYDDGGFSGGSMERPALQKLLDDVLARKIDVIVVYKVDRLTRSLADFAKLVELFDAHGVSFISVTQAFNTTTSMGRLTLNMPLSFAQFEREITGERKRCVIREGPRGTQTIGSVLPTGARRGTRCLQSGDGQRFWPSQSSAPASPSGNPRPSAPSTRFRRRWTPRKPGGPVRWPSTRTSISGIDARVEKARAFRRR